MIEFVTISNGSGKSSQGKPRLLGVVLLEILGGYFLSCVLAFCFCKSPTKETKKGRTYVTFCLLSANVVKFGLHNTET